MIDIINAAINRKLNSISFTEIIIGTVTSLNPFKIRINDRIEVGLEFIEPSSLGISDDSPLPSLPLTVGDKVQMVRYNRGQRFYVLTGFRDLYNIIYPIGSVITCQKDTFNAIGDWMLLDEETIEIEDEDDIIIQRWLRKE
jgi:hypothetical protein